MHLPTAMLRRIAAATAAVAISGGVLYLAKPAKQPEADGSMSALLASGQADGVIELGPPLKLAPAGSDPELEALFALEAEPVPKVKEYTVEPGDSVGAIAERFGLKAETILYANNMSGTDYIQPGDTLVIPSVDGILYTVRRGDTLWDIAMETGVDQDEIIKVNPEVDPTALQIDQTLLIPGAEPTRRGMVASARGGTRAALRKFDYWPASGQITDYFGQRVHPVYGTTHLHDGLDLGVASGTPLRAVAGGTVTMAGWFGGYGITVRIDHGSGIVTQYSHMSSTAVSVGQWVEAGQTIGNSGNTGVSTGPHLHFMVIQGGTAVDPLPWLP